VTARTTAELRERRDAAAGVDLVELRLDGVADPDARGALDGRRLPAIVTCRPVWEGGAFSGSEEERHRLLEQAVEAGAEYVDVEWRAGFRDSLIGRTSGAGLIVSVHDFAGIPDDLLSLHRAMRQTGASICKLAFTARRLTDVFAADGLAKDAGSRTTGPGRVGGTVVIAMGTAGMATRVLPGRFHSQWTYAGDCAPGQIPAERLLTEFRFREITPATAVYGVVGSRSGGSRSPSLHNAAFRAAGVDAVYLPLETADFSDFLAFADRLPLLGASVTMPFKEVAMACAAEVDDIGRAVGAVNTLRRVSAGWSATNTDVDGFLDPIRDLPLRGRRVAIIGAGGAARAVAVAAGRCGARVSVFGRHLGRARLVAALADGDAFEGVPGRGSWDLLVNATPVGASPDVDRTPVDAERLEGGVVYDLVYDPPVTRLMREARAAGCRTVGGLDMLVAQAQRQNEWWTGARS
jgi:3-dehydroquinate dehydratase/shikimate dehydrogenase